MAFATAAIILFAVLLTSTLSGIFGMGGGMILMGVLAITVPLKTAMILHGSIQLGANGFRAALLRRHIRGRIVGFVAFGALASLALFTWLQLRLRVDAVFLVLGGLPIVALLVPKKLGLTIERPFQALVCGALFGGLQLVAGASGPILDAFFLRGTLTRFEIVATKAAIGAMGHIIKLVYWGALLKTAESAGASPTLIAVCVLAAFIGTRFGKSMLVRLGETSFQRYSRVLVLAIALIYLGRGLC